MTTKEQLLRAQITIAELLLFISITNIDCENHWAHPYALSCGPFVEYSSRKYPDSTLAEHIVKSFEDTNESL